jgi:hypothetical protein
MSKNWIATDKIITPATNPILIRKLLNLVKSNHRISVKMAPIQFERTDVINVLEKKSGMSSNDK